MSAVQKTLGPLFDTLSIMDFRRLKRQYYGVRKAVPSKRTLIIVIFCLLLSGWIEIKPIDDALAVILVRGETAGRVAGSVFLLLLVILALNFFAKLQTTMSLKWALWFSYAFISAVLIYVIWRGVTTDKWDLDIKIPGFDVPKAAGGPLFWLYVIAQVSIVILSKVWIGLAPQLVSSAGCCACRWMENFVLLEETRESFTYTRSALCFGGAFSLCASWLRIGVFFRLLNRGFCHTLCQTLRILSLLCCAPKKVSQPANGQRFTAASRRFNRGEPVSPVTMRSGEAQALQAGDLERGSGGGGVELRSQAAAAGSAAGSVGAVAASPNNESQSRKRRPSLGLLNFWGAERNRELRATFNDERTDRAATLRSIPVPGSALGASSMDGGVRDPDRGGQPGCCATGFPLPFQHVLRYRGSRDDEGRPHGEGEWLEDQDNGEIIKGLWHHGEPIAPFVSQEVGSGSIFVALRVAFASCRHVYFESRREREREAARQRERARNAGGNPVPLRSTSVDGEEPGYSVPDTVDATTRGSGGRGRGRQRGRQGRGRGGPRSQSSSIRSPSIACECVEKGAPEGSGVSSLVFGVSHVECSVSGSFFHNYPNIKFFNPKSAGVCGCLAGRDRAALRKSRRTLMHSHRDHGGGLSDPERDTHRNGRGGAARAGHSLSPPPPETAPNLQSGGFSPTAGLPPPSTAPTSAEPLLINPGEKVPPTTLLWCLNMLKPRKKLSRHAPTPHSPVPFATQPPSDARRLSGVNRSSVSPRSHGDSPAGAGTGGITGLSAEDADRDVQRPLLSGSERENDKDSRQKKRSSGKEKGGQKARASLGVSVVDVRDRERESPFRSHTAATLRTTFPPHLSVHDHVAKEAVIFIHGFNTALHHGCSQFGQLIALARLPTALRPFVFSWPGDILGSLAPLFYPAAVRRSKQRKLGEAFADFIKVLAESGIEAVHLLSHSCGARAFFNGLNGCYRRGLFATCDDAYGNAMPPPSFFRQVELDADNHSAEGSFISEDERDEENPNPEYALPPEKRMKLKSAIILNPDYPLDDFLEWDYFPLRGVCENIVLYGDSKDAALGYAEYFHREKSLGKRIFDLRFPKGSAPPTAEGIARSVSMQMHLNMQRQGATGVVALPTAGAAGAGSSFHRQGSHASSVHMHRHTFADGDVDRVMSEGREGQMSDASFGNENSRTGGRRPKEGGDKKMRGTVRTLTALGAPANIPPPIDELEHMDMPGAPHSRAAGLNAAGRPADFPARRGSDAQRSNPHSRVRAGKKKKGKEGGGTMTVFGRLRGETDSGQRVRQPRLESSPLGESQSGRDAPVSAPDMRSALSEGAGQARNRAETESSIFAHPAPVRQEEVRQMEPSRSPAPEVPKEKHLELLPEEQGAHLGASAPRTPAQPQAVLPFDPSSEVPPGERSATSVPAERAPGETVALPPSTVVSAAERHGETREGGVVEEGGGERGDAFGSLLVINGEIDRGMSAPTREEDEEEDADGDDEGDGEGEMEAVVERVASGDGETSFEDSAAVIEGIGGVVGAGLPNFPWLDMDVVDTTFIEHNSDTLRHCFYNINRDMVDDIRDVLVSNRRAVDRNSRLELRRGNVYCVRVAPAVVRSLVG